MTAPTEQEQREAVVAEAYSWLRTKYHHMGDIKYEDADNRGGVDCAMLLVRIYGTVGLVPPDLDPRPYPADWHLHRSDERYLGFLEEYGVPVQTPGLGDVAVYQFGRCFSHGAILVAPDTVIHSYMKQGVTLASTLVDPLVDRPVTYYTLWPGVLSHGG